VSLDDLAQTQTAAVRAACARACALARSTVSETPSAESRRAEHEEEREGNQRLFPTLHIFSSLENREKRAKNTYVVPKTKNFGTNLLPFLSRQSLSSAPVVFRSFPRKSTASRASARPRRDTPRRRAGGTRRLHAARTMSSQKPRRSFSARKALERWTADIERAHVDETPTGYALLEKRFASVPWREIPTRTRALQAHEFVNPTAYVVHEKDAYVNPAHYLEKHQLLEADRAVREAKASERRAMILADAAHLKTDARLRREVLAKKESKISRRAFGIVENLVRPHERDPVTGEIRDRSGEYSRLGAREKRLEPPLSDGKNRRRPWRPPAVAFRIENAREGSEETDESSGRNRFVSAHHLGTSNASFALIRPKKVTPGERVALVHGPRGRAPGVPSKKTSGARGGKLAAKTQSFGYSFGGSVSEDEAGGFVSEKEMTTLVSSRRENDDARDGAPPRKKTSAAAAPPGLSAFAARTATVEERYRWAAARRPASARSAAVGAGRVPFSMSALRKEEERISISRVDASEGTVDAPSPPEAIPARSASARRAN